MVRARTSMTKKSAEILEIHSGQRNNTKCSQSFQVLMSKWQDISGEFDAIIEEEDACQGNHATQKQIESRYEKAGYDQRDLFEAASKLNANKFADVLAKLELWKAVTCPGHNTGEPLSLAEEILLSAYYDMNRLVARNEDI